jgi:hypothetical protein
MADVEQHEVSTEPQARHVVYCGGKLFSVANRSVDVFSLADMHVTSLHTASRGA